MFTDNGLGAGMEGLSQVLETADVLTVGFTVFPERLLVDTRHNQWEGPLVALVGPVQTVQERFLWLGQHRGAFGVPEAFSFFIWPGSVRSLVDSDALAPLRARLKQVSSGSDSALDDLLGKLLDLEREAWRGAIRGNERWATVWERQAS